MAYFTGGKGEIARLKEAVQKLREEAITEVKTATLVTVQSLMDKTPVWSGETVRNYAVGIGSKPSGGSKGSVGTEAPGPTSRMALGREPRRPDNEAAALADAKAALSTMRDLKDVVITNLVDAEKWDLIDSGSAPTPDTARYPGGVAIAGEQKAKQMLPRWK